MKLPKFSFCWQKEINATEILIIGKLLTCLILSIVSAFIDIVFFSGLSKSDYPFFSMGIPAAIILSIMSIGFSGGKFFVAMQLATIKEIETRLRELKYECVKRFFWLKLKWNLVHKFLVSISIITSISLSVITIGNGVRKMEQNIKNMTIDAQYLIDLSNSIKNGNADKREAAKSNITGTLAAKSDAKEEVERYFSRLQNYQNKYFEIQDDETLTPEEKHSKGEEIISKIVKEIPGASRKNAIYFSKADLQKTIQNTALENEKEDNSSIYEEAVAYDEQELETYIIAIQDKDYKFPDGSPIVFVEDGKPVNRQLAISRLQKGIMEWQSDTGDAGASSKIFTLVATYLKADEKAGGLGASEIMMMLLIMIFGIVQEFLIAIFTPKVAISRKMLSQFSEYLDGVDLNMFMLVTYKSYLDRGIISTEAFEEKSKKAVLLMENSIEDIIKKNSSKSVKKEPKKRTAPKKKEFSSKVDGLVKEIEEML